jgi:hypothetical protein
MATDQQRAKSAERQRRHRAKLKACDGVTVTDKSVTVTEANKSHKAMFADTDTGFPAFPVGVTKTRKKGRPSQYTPENVKKVLENVELGIPYRYAALSVGISDETFRAWQHRYPEFAAQVEQARAKCIVAHMSHIKSVAARDGLWTPSTWVLEHCFDEFVKPETRVQIANIAGMAKSDDPTIGWLESPVGQPQSLPETFSEAELQLLAPQASSDIGPLEPANLPDESVKLSAKPVETELDHSMKAYAAKSAKPLKTTEIEELQRSGSARPSQTDGSRGRVIVARPSPPPSNGYNEFGERPYL